MSNQADSSAANASPKRQQRARNSSSRLLSYRIPKAEEARLREAFTAVNPGQHDVDIVDADLMRWCIQSALQKNALQQQLEKVNTAYVNVSDELATLKTSSQQLSTQLSRHFQIEETPDTREFVEWQQRRAKANMKGSETLTAFVTSIYTALKQSMKNRKEELLA